MTPVMTIANAQVKQFLNSKKQRTHCHDGNEYVLEFERNKYDPQALTCTTWGYDYAEMRIPRDYTELVNLRMRAKLNILSTLIPTDVLIRFYENIFRKVNA